MLFHDVWHDARQHREWFDVFSRGLKDKPSGAQIDELFVWFFQSGEQLDGKTPSMTHQPHADAVNDVLTHEGRLFVRWKLLKLDSDHTKRFTDRYRFPLPPVARIRVTKHGASVEKRSPFWRDIEFSRLILLTLAEQKFNELRVPIAVANFVFLIVKVSLSWTSVSAQIAGIVGAGMLLLASIARAAD